MHKIAPSPGGDFEDVGTGRLRGPYNPDKVLTFIMSNIAAVIPDKAMALLEKAYGRGSFSDFLADIRRAKDYYAAADTVGRAPLYDAIWAITNQGERITTANGFSKSSAILAALALAGGTDAPTARTRLRDLLSDPKKLVDAVKQADETLRIGGDIINRARHLFSRRGRVNLPQLPSAPQGAASLTMQGINSLEEYMGIELPGMEAGSIFDDMASAAERATAETLQDAADFLTGEGKSERKTNPLTRD